MSTNQLQQKVMYVTFLDLKLLFGDLSISTRCTADHDLSQGATFVQDCKLHQPFLNRFQALDYSYEPDSVNYS